MSWSATLPRDGVEPAASADEIDVEAFTLSPAELSEGSRSQFAAAIDVAKVLAGEVEGPVRVSCSGHSNRPNGTGAAEVISVFVSQAAPPA